MSIQVDSAPVYTDDRIEIKIGENGAGNMFMTAELLPQQEATEQVPEIAPHWGDLDTSLPSGDQHKELRRDLRALSTIYRNNWDRLFARADSPLGWIVWNPKRYLGEEVANLALVDGEKPGHTLLRQAQGGLIARFESRLTRLTRYKVHPGESAPRCWFATSLREIRFWKRCESLACSRRSRDQDKPSARLINPISYSAKFLTLTSGRDSK